MTWDKKQELLLEQGLRQIFARLGKSIVWENGAEEFAAQLCQVLSSYARIMLRWHKKFHLLGRQNERQFVSLHLLDSISGALLLADEDLIAPGSLTQIIDVGSGLGLPGIPLALCLGLWRVACREFKFFLVEPAPRRANILRSILAELGLAAEVCEHPVEEWHRRQFPAEQQLLAAKTSQRIITCRAFRPLDKKCWKLLRRPLENIWQQPHVKSGVLLYKGNWATATAELAALRLRAQKKFLFELPQCGHRRSLFYVNCGKI